ncbi:MAG: rRNA maturation RNase YbeY [Lentisphaeria bacterium]|nr:rRNA maturation RNase YbeY [Lentisphaeria bacterium]
MFRRFAAEAVRVTQCGISSCLSFSFVSASEMKKANRELVGHEGITDVISFDYREADMPTLPEGEEVTEADLIVCPAAAEEQGRKRNIPYGKELALYVVHGLLHAAGCDDTKSTLKKKMRRREKQCMDELVKLFDWEKLFPRPVPREAGEKS